MNTRESLLAALRQDVTDWPQGELSFDSKEIQALLDVVESAQRLVDKPFGQLVSRDFYALREALSKIDAFPVRA